MKIYIFVRDKFRFVEDFNNHYRKDYSYDVWKEKLKDWKIIDTVEESSEQLAKGFNNDDIILCVGAERVFERIPFNYFSTRHTKDFFHYLKFMKIKHNVD